MENPDQALIHLHIPKTAGITFREIISQQYHPRAHYKIDGERISESVAQFKALPEARRAEIRLLTGHMPFGLHEFLPRRSLYITLLRSPVQRLLSHYYFVLRQPNHYLHSAVTLQKMSLGDYIRSGLSPELDNGQTRYISGSLDLPFGACAREHVELAKRNLLKHFAIVGLVEGFDETLLLAKKRFGWESVFYTRKNVTEGRLRQDQLARSELAAIEVTNGFDLELYDFARVLFEKQLASLQPRFALEVDFFRSLNHFYQDYMHLRSKGRFTKALVRRALGLARSA
jgi:hypothetical protein